MTVVGEAVPVAAPVRVGGSRTRVVVAGTAIAVAFGFVLFKGLGSATLYFRTAKEAVEQRSSLGTRRFRVEGIVLPGTVKQVGETVHFTIEQDGVDLNIVHRGDPPEMFKANADAVLEGRFDPTPGAGATPVFASDRILVKHGSSYDQKHPDRVKNYVGQTKP